MSIALYDNDIIQTPNCHRFNIQLMKLAAYYKQQREMVSMITDLSRAKYYTKVYFRSNSSRIEIPADLYKYDNIDIGGYSFMNNYVPLPPEIEHMDPDLSIYSKITPEKTRCPVKYRDIFKGAHIQISTNQKDIDIYSIPPLSMFTPIYIHDRVIIPEMFDWFQDNFNKNHRCNFVFPQCTDDTSILDKLSVVLLGEHTNKIGIKTSINYNKIKKIIDFQPTCAFSQLVFLLPPTNAYEQFYTALKCCIYAASQFTQFCMTPNFKDSEVNAVFSGLSTWSRLHTGRGKGTFDAYMHKSHPELLKTYNDLIHGRPQVKQLTTLYPQIIHDNGGILP